MSNLKINTNLINQVITFYKSKPVSLKKVCEKFNLSFPTVQKILKNIDKYPKALVYNPDLVEDYFKIIDTEEKAYFLGLIIADGNVFVENNTSANRQASISITLSTDDKYILDTFKRCISTNTTISSDDRGCSQIAVRSNKMAKDLEKLGVTPRKSFNTFLPEINKCLYNHLIRGILDGDGNISAHLIQSGRFLHKIAFCGSNKLMENISEYLYTELKLKQRPKVYNYKDRILSEIAIVNIEDMKSVGNYIYNNASVFLYRKYNTYLNFLQHYKIHDNTEVITEIA